MFFIKKIFKMKDEVFNFFINDLDYFINKIIRMKNIYSSFEPSIVIDNDTLPNVKLIDEIYIIDNYIEN